MSNKDVKVLCSSMKGTADREITIEGTTYLLDEYDLNQLIEALRTVRDVAFATVDRRIKKK